MTEPGGRKEGAEGGVEGIWSAPLQGLHNQFLGWLEEEEGIMGWPMIENVRALKKGEFEQFVAYWKKRGIFVEPHGNGGIGNVSLKATNSRKPILIDGGGWFQVWTDRVEGFRRNSMRELKTVYGEENEGFNRLNKIGFHPGVWIGPDFEPVYISQHARDLLIKNADKIERLLYLSTERGRHSGKDIAAHAIPAPFAFINENLTQEHIDAIFDGIQTALPEARENLMAYMLRALSTVKTPEELTPGLIKSTFEKAKLLIGPAREKWGREEKEEPETLAKDIGEFITMMGKKFDPAYLDAFLSSTDYVRGKSNYFIDNLGTAFFVPARGEAITADEFEKCLLKAGELLSGLEINDDKNSFLQGALPHIVRTMRGESTTSELFEQVCIQLKRLSSVPSEMRGHCVGAIEAWAWSVKNDSNEGLPVAELPGILDEVLALNRVVGGKNANALFGNIIGPVIRGQDGYFPLELLARYREEIEKITSTQPELLAKTLAHDWEIEILMHHSSDTMSPDNIRRYIELLGVTPKSVFQTATYIYSPSMKDVGPETLGKCVAFAHRINAVAEKVGSKVPIDAVRDLVGHRGMGNDEKTIDEALRLTEPYVLFLEQHTRRVKILCPPVSEDNWRGGYDQQRTLLREFVSKHRGEVTPRLNSSLERD